MSILTLAASAQNINAEKSLLKNDKMQEVKISESLLQLPSAAEDSRWFGPIFYLNEELDLFANAGDLFSRVRPMPDSNLIRGFYSDGSIARIINHGMAVMMDPGFEDFDYLSENNPYTVDSVSVSYAYSRNLADDAVVDSIRLTILTGPTAGAYTTDGSSDTLRFGVIEYLPNADLSKMGKIDPVRSQQVITIPLTSADTSSFIEQHAFNIADYDVAANGRVGLFAEFVPATQYGISDTIWDVNYMTFGSWEEEKDSDPSYVFDMGLNQSYVLPNDVRYNTNTNGWDSNLVVTGAYGAGFTSEHHDFRFKLTTPNLSSEEFDGIGVTLAPNPTNGIVKVNTTSVNTQVEVFNMLGQKIVTRNESGNFDLDLTAEKAGIYFVTIKNELGTATSKIVRK